MKSRVLTEIKPYIIAFASSAVPALVFTLLVRLCFMNEVFLRTLFTLLAWLGGAAALLSPLIIALVRFSRLLYAPTAAPEESGSGSRLPLSTRPSLLPRPSYPSLPRRPIPNHPSPSRPIPNRSTPPVPSFRADRSQYISSRGIASCSSGRGAACLGLFAPSRRRSHPALRGERAGYPLRRLRLFELGARPLFGACPASLCLGGVRTALPDGRSPRSAARSRREPALPFPSSRSLPAPFSSFLI